MDFEKWGLSKYKYMNVALDCWEADNKNIR